MRRKFLVTVFLAMVVLATSVQVVGADSIADHVVISEIQTDSTEGSGGSSDDFIELYNPTSEDIDLNTASYRLERWTSLGNRYIVLRFSSTGDGTFPGGTTISAHGFYLVVDNGASDESLKAKADALVTRPFALGNDSAVGLGTDSMDGPTDEDTIDFVGWGNGGMHEGSGAASNPPGGKSIQRRVNATLTYLYPYAPAWDSNDNSADFFVGDPNPTNSTTGSANPLYPIPELNTTLLFSTGLLALAGYVLLTKRGN
jgi:hypothetical protein